jgi:dethiobiotin synthetase
MRQSSPRAALTRLAKPVAPPLAAEAEGTVLSLDSWTSAIDRLSDENDLVLVEGAGGLLSPLTWQATLRDLIRSSGARALVVASDRLGSINHALLTMEALGRAAIGVVFSAPANRDESTGTNADAFSRMMPGARVATMDRFRSWEQAAGAVAGIASWVDG